MNNRPTFGDTAWTAAADDSPWRSTFELLLGWLRRWVWLIIAFAMFCAGLGATVKLFVPPKYTATSQILVDPRGLKIFSNELTAGYFDANSAISFVESQMGILQSERVLSRVINSECGTANKEDRDVASEQAKESLTRSFMRLCPGQESDYDWDKALQALRRMITIKRAERSFVVDITASGSSPQAAARLAAAVVSAYMQEDANTRSEVARRLTEDLSGRLSSLRQALRDSEAKADVYRSDQNLVRVADKLLVEQKLAAATAALNDTRARLDRVSIRAKQIEAAPRTLGAMGALGALGAEADTRTLQALTERRNAALVELAPIASRAGDRHPMLVELRSRLAEVDRAIAIELNSIRTVARADLSRVQMEYDNLEAAVVDLSGKVTRARQAEAELRTLEQETEANRKLLESFETRSREAREFGRIDSGNLRVVSVARTPETHRLMPGLVLWALLGGFLGLVLSVSMIMLWTLVFGTDAPPRREEPEYTGGQGPAYVMRLRAEAFARYRYG